MRNLSRLSAAANRQAATDDLVFVLRQLVNAGHKPPLEWREGLSAKEIDKVTRSLIDWAKENGAEIELPDGWSNG